VGHKIFLDIQSEHGEYTIIFYIILPIPWNIIMDLNNVMLLLLWVFKVKNVGVVEESR
jgi:hypothetical protein